MASPNQLPAPRLVVTAVDSSGASTFSADEHLTPFFPFGPHSSSFTSFHSSSKVPVSSTEMSIAPQNVLPRCPPAGVWFGTTDIPPRYSAPLHRTLSCDYAAIISGEIVLRLEGGEEKTVRSGEFIVQKGVSHEWINRSDKPCRMLFVMLGSEKIILEDGTALEETVLGKK